MFSAQGPVPGGLCPAFGRTRCGRRPAGKGSPGVEQPEGFPQKAAWLLGAFKPWVNTAYHKRGRLQPSSRAERDFSRRGAVLRPSGARPAPTEPAGETNPNGEAAFCAEKCGEPQGFAATWSVRPIKMFAKTLYLQGFAGQRRLFFLFFGWDLADFLPKGDFSVRPKKISAYSYFFSF